MKSSIKRNLGYQTVYQILNTCLPLITAPFLSRILGAENLGIYSYITSISSFFVLFAMLGIVNYGTRLIAECNNEKDRISSAFSEIYTIQLTMSLACSILYAGYVHFFCRDNTLIALIQGITVIACAMNINWVFFGLEEFKLTVMRNMVIRLTTVVLILLLVRNSSDLWVYTLLMAGGTMISDAVLWIYLPSRRLKIKIAYKGIKKHIKPILVLFIPLLAMSVYHLMDKAMLGWLSTFQESGYYYNADKVINIPVGVILGVGTVMLPRITALVNSGRKEEADKLFLNTVEALVLVSSAIAFGIASISNEFIPFFFGDGYDSCVLLTIVLSPVLIIKALSLTIRNAYLVPNHKDKVYIHSVAAGAIVNTIINYLLIPRYDSMGAVIGTLVAEEVACIWQYFVVRKELHFSQTFLRCLPYLCFGCIMFYVVRLSANMLTMSPLLIKIAAEITIGAIVFITLSFVYWKLTKNNLYRIILNK